MYAFPYEMSSIGYMDKCYIQTCTGCGVAYYWSDLKILKFLRECIRFKRLEMETAKLEELRNSRGHTNRRGVDFLPKLKKLTDIIGVFCEFPNEQAKTLNMWNRVDE